MIIKSVDELTFLENKLGRLGRRIVLKNINVFVKGKIKVIRLPIKDKVLTLYIEDKDVIIISPKSIQKHIQRYVTENTEYSLLMILSYVLDTYYDILLDIKRRINEFIKKLFEERLINLDKIYNLLKDIENLEDYVNILRRAYKLIISNKEYINIIEEEIFHLIDEIEETYNKIHFLIQMRSEILQKQLDKKMEKLTKVSMVFLPATLIAGIYGMNFTKVLPAWNHPTGFLIALILIFLSSLLTYLWLK